MTAAKKPIAAAAPPSPPTREQLIALELQKQKTLRRMIAARKSRDSLLEFTKFTMPDPEDVDDVQLSMFETSWHHEAICQLLEKVERGEILRAIITMPPRHGKSELCSRRFPAWFTGRDPYRQTIFATYGADFAEDFGRKAREVFEMPQYRQIFPRVALKAKSKAADRMETEAGGMLVWIGVGGPATGRGADCVAGPTIVDTDRGQMTISQLVAADDRPLILSFDHDAHSTRYNRVIATRRIEGRHVWRLVTESGREVVGTPDHRVYSKSREGYVRLSSLQVGERVVVGEGQSPTRVARRADHACSEMLALRKAVFKTELRSAEGDSQGVRRPVLRIGMLTGAPCGEKQSPMRSVRSAAPEIEKKRSSDGPRLLCRVLNFVAARQVHAEAGVSRVRNMVLAALGASAVLLARLRQRGSLAADDWGRKFSFQGRDLLRGMVPTYAVSGAGARWEQMRGLRCASKDGGIEAASKKQSAHSPFGREPGQQSRGKFGDDVRDLSRRSAQVHEESVAVVEQVCGEEVDVYDIQVERDSNFFANSILVHNCLILDDPLKNREEAESLTHRNKVWDWFTSVAYTRLMPGGRICTVLTRWHEDDIVGRIFNPDYVDPIEAKKWYRLDLPAIIEENTEQERALWPERYPLDVLKSTRAFIGERDWNALYQQRPTPPEGAFFRQEMIFTYDADEMPKNFRPYMTGDLALGEKKSNDETCVGKWMLDENDTLYLHPDLYWDRKSADASVERIIDMMTDFAPMATWWEKGQIDRAVGPFFRKRMMERKVYSWLTALPVKGDKAFRASSIRGRMALGKVKFPRFASWWPRAKEQLLKFTGKDGDPDDFCFAAGTMVAMADGTEKPIERVSIGDMVETPIGPRNVIASASTGVRETIKIDIANARSITVTPNHPIWSETRNRFVSAGELCQNEMLKLKPSSSTASSIDATQTASIAIFASISKLALAAVSCTATFGKSTSARFQRALPFITRMATAGTMTPPISNVCLAGSISGNTAWNDSRTRLTVSGKPSIWQAFVRWLRSGTNPRLAAFGIARTPKHGSAALVRRARPARKREVFNLTVADAHTFYANGVLVHNCDMCSLIGQALGSQIKASTPTTSHGNVVPIAGTLGWIKYDSDYRKREKKRLEARKGF